MYIIGTSVYSCSYFCSMKLTKYHISHCLKSKIAANITEEQGKTLVDAEGDVLRGLRKLNFSYHLFTKRIILFCFQKNIWKSNNPIIHSLSFKPLYLNNK